MFILVSENSIDDIEVGSRLIKYPVPGNPVEEVSEDYDRNVAFEYVVARIDQEGDHFELAIPLFPDIEMAGMGVVPGLIHKFRDDLIDERLWWIEQP